MTMSHCVRASGLPAVILGLSSILPAQLMGHSANSEHGYPAFYVDGVGNTAAHCIDWTDPYCGHLPFEDPAYGQPLDVANGVFWGESFYWLCIAEAAVPGGDLEITFALEGVWGNAAEAVRNGDQTVFSRIRFRMDSAQPGTYTILHPFGENTFENVGTGRRAINHTEDCLHTVVNGSIVPSCGNGPGRWFDTGLDPDISRIDRFLYWDPAVPPAAPAGYYGDPNVLHPIAGASNGRNKVIVRGPGIGGPNNEMEITNFMIVGKRGPQASLTSSPRYLDASSGGVQTLQLDVGPAGANHGYFILSSVMTTAPGITLPGGMGIPLSLDGLYAFALQADPLPFAINYAGMLDGDGRATATLTVPPFPALAGMDLYQSFLSGPWLQVAHASNNTTLSMR